MKRRDRPLPILVLLCALSLTGLPQAAVGQVSEAEAFLSESVTLEVRARPGTELKPGDDLGTLLAEGIRVSSNEDGKPIQLGLWVEAFSQREGSLGRFDAYPVSFEPGRSYPGKAWIQEPGQVGELAAPMFGDRRKEGLVVKQVVVINHEEQYVVINHEEQHSIARRDGEASIAFPDVCKDAPYALVIGVSAPELRGSPSASKCVVCVVN